jgi:hypothetical protein
VVPRCHEKKDRDMKRKRLSGFIGVRLPMNIQDAIEALADKREMAVAELAREYIQKGLLQDGIKC